MLGRQFANPYLRCLKCQGQVVGVSFRRNKPCGHRADYRNACLSWGPVDGCVCQEIYGTVFHD